MALSVNLSDYILDFSTEADSVKLLYFSLYFQQPTERDDMEQGIAGGHLRITAVAYAPPMLSGL